MILIARLLLALILAGAALGKLSDVEGFRRTLRKLGLRAPLDRIALLGVPLAELSVSLALLFRGSAAAGAVGAVVLLSLFAVVVLWVVLTGREVECRCFGNLGAATMGWWTALRNGLFLLLGIWSLPRILADPGPGLPELLARLTGTQFLLLGNVLAVGMLGVLCLLLWRQQGRLLVRLEALEGGRPTRAASAAPRGAPIGAVLPGVGVRDASGREVRLRQVLPPKGALLLLFVQHGCGHCRALLPWIERWAADRDGDLRLAVVADEEERSAIAEEIGGIAFPLLGESGRAVSKAFGVEAVPSAVLIRSDGRLGSRVATGPAEIQALVSGSHAPQGSGNGNGLVDDPANAPSSIAPAGVGASLVPLGLRDVDGKPIPFDDGTERLLLFWNPGCPFCAEMVPTLREWARREGNGKPGLVAIFRSRIDPDVEASAIVVDRQGELASRLGVRGTPSAALVDGSGRLASKIVHGGPNVLHLLGYSNSEPAIR